MIKDVLCQRLYIEWRWAQNAVLLDLELLTPVLYGVGELGGIREGRWPQNLQVISSASA
jgi:hypothetical protein